MRKVSAVLLNKIGILACVAAAAWMGGNGVPGLAPDRVAALPLEDAKVRVNVAGRQRMLTQRMTKASCMIALGVERDFHMQMLEASHADFAKALAALEHGDSDLRITEPENNSKVLRGLELVKSHWTPVDDAIRGMMGADDFAGTRAEVLYAENMPLLVEMNEVVSLIEQAHANPGQMLLASAVAINIAGRQRMLSQRIGKEFCQLVLRWNTETVSTALRETIGLFEASHGALANGMQAAGIIAPPTDEIGNALDALKHPIKNLNRKGFP
ncbi:MAG: type IV pili methyl-accepting chemotaxis transducer N-terminal domain-containing protein [Pseudomonadota bacterium]